MRVIEDYSDIDNIVEVDVTDAIYNGDYLIQIVFSDGKTRTVDFAPFLNKAKHPSIRKYLDLNNFKSFQILDGNLNWNNYEMIFPVWDLYRGKL